MRLRRLILGRYGHLTDVEIAFPDTPDLHIVVGPNEAGKSTALSAIGDALFRFPHKTLYDFLHGTRGLRIGVELQARDGRQDVFFRRKGRRDDLLDGNEQPVSEAAIAAFLGGATRERFDTVFGLNGTILRAGGKAITEGKGDAGSAIMSAYAGVHDYRRLAEKLDEAAGRLFGDKRGQRAFHVAAERYQQARQELNHRRVDPEAWKTASAERAILEQAQSDIKARAAALHAERTQLDRTRRTTPFCRRLGTLVAERDGLGPVPELPNDAVSRFSEAAAARDQATRDVDRERRNLEGLELQLANLPPDDLVLGQADAIDALVADRQRILGAMKDREPQLMLAGQRKATMVEEGSQLGLSLGPDALAAKCPKALGREKVTLALSAYDRLEERQATAASRLAEAETRRNEARQQLEVLPEMAPPAALRQVIDRVKAEGRLDADVAGAKRGIDTARADLDHDLSALPHWEGGGAALAALPVPLTAEIDRVGTLLDRDRQALRDSDSLLADHDRELTRLDAEASADAVAGNLPTEAAIQDVRQRRDSAWTLIRRAHLEGGAPISDAEREGSDLGPDTAGGYEALIHAADNLSDRRTREQERVVAAEQRLRRRIERHALRDSDLALRQRLADQLEQSETEWRLLWQPAGLEPRDPPAMKEWLSRRSSVLGRYATEQAAVRKDEDVTTRYSAAMADLTALLGSPMQAVQTLAVRLKGAEALCKEQETQATARAMARKELDAAEAEHRRAVAAVSAVEAELAVWWRNWAAVVEILALPPETRPGLGRAALRHWERIDEAARERQAALDRVAQMTAEIDRYAADTAAVVSRVAPDLARQPALEAVGDLAARLAGVRRNKEVREQLAARQHALAQEIVKYTRHSDDAAGILHSLRWQAQAADDDELSAALGRWQRLRDLAEKIAAEEVELHRLDDGKTLAELGAEAKDVDFDQISARIAAIEADLAAIEADARSNLERLLRLKDEMAAMEKGQDAAAAAQMMEGALADIDDVVLRYPALRMAQTLLRAGIERFRRQQQGPLLHRASTLFARLTEGRYDRLEVDEDDNGSVHVVARQTGGTDCRADRLSDGTLDQLYLALRLAAIEADAAAGEPLPFIGDDLLVNFDDDRAKAALRVLSDFSRTTQVILLTHHDHIAGMAEPGLASIHRLRSMF